MIGEAVAAYSLPAAWFIGTIAFIQIFLFFAFHSQLPYKLILIIPAIKHLKRRFTLPQSLPSREGRFIYILILLSNIATHSLRGKDTICFSS